MSSNKPKVFVSSTIYDFRDLRSAIKYWLEQHGYEVRMSDQNDFPQDPALNSYDSCLQAIDDSDYFILLIGGRVGGWYDEPARISITRMEYRRAYELAKQGKLKLLSFVRKEVWDIREDRNQLKKYLASESGKELELTEADIRAIASHPSKFVTDAETTFDFLKEVGRVPEMKDAAAKKGALPPGNWIHQFATFRDIADAMKVGMRISGSLQRATLAANLKHEILQNLCRITYKGDDGRVLPDYLWANRSRNNLKGGMYDTSSFTGEELGKIGVLLMTKGSIGKQLSTMALNEAITSGEFLDFDVTTGQHIVSVPQRAMLLLAEAIQRLCWAGEQAGNVGTQLIPKYRDRKAETFLVKNTDVVVGFVVHDNLYNVTHLSKAIYKYLHDGNEAHLSVGAVPIYPTTPFLEQAQQIKEEHPDSSEVLRWIFEQRHKQ